MTKNPVKVIGGHSVEADITFDMAIYGGEALRPLRECPPHVKLGIGALRDGRKDKRSWVRWSGAPDYHHVSRASRRARGGWRAESHARTGLRHLRSGRSGTRVRLLEISFRRSGAFHPCRNTGGQAGHAAEDSQPSSAARESSVQCGEPRDSRSSISVSKALPRPARIEHPAVQPRSERMHARKPAPWDDLGSACPSICQRCCAEREDLGVRVHLLGINGPPFFQNGVQDQLPPLRRRPPRRLPENSVVGDNQPAPWARVWSLAPAIMSKGSPPCYGSSRKRLVSSTARTIASSALNPDFARALATISLGSVVGSDTSQFQALLDD